MKKLTCLIFIGAFIFSSCKKNNEKDCSLSETNMAAKYKITAIKYQASATSPEQDFFDQSLEPCEKDDITSIVADHTYVYSDAGTTCSPNGDYSGTWSLSGNTLSLDGDPATLEDFNCTGFSLVVTDIIVPGDKGSIRYTRQ